MDNQDKTKSKKQFPIGIWLYPVLFLALIWIINLEHVNSWLSWILTILRPVLIGLGLAYLLNPVFRFFERRVFARLRPQSLRRVLAMLSAYLALLILLGLILLLILPQLIESILSFLGSYDSYITSGIAQINGLFAWINGLVERLTGNAALLEYLDEAAIRQEAAALFSNLDRLGETLSSFLSGVDIKPIQNFFGEAISIVTDSIFGIFVSIYLLGTKEKRHAQIMKLRRAIFSTQTNVRITRLCSVADRSFGSFVEGKLLDSIVVWLLLYLILSLFRIPYAIVFASFLAITNIIPFIGLIIGTIPSALILFFTAPGKLIAFLIIVLIIQQIEVNIISPKILGRNTGISSLCVMIAISVMGHLWGLLGMLLAVPLFATALELFDEYIVNRLQQKGRLSGLANYYAADAAVDPIKNASLTTDRATQRFEKRAHALLGKRERGDKLTRRETLSLALYQIACKYHILIDMSDETHARYAAEEAMLAAEIEAVGELNRIRAARATAHETVEVEEALEVAGENPQTSAELEVADEKEAH